MHKEYWIYILCLIKSLTLFGTKGLWQQTGLLFSNWEGLALFLDENGITESDFRCSRIMEARVQSIYQNFSCRDSREKGGDLV